VYGTTISDSVNKKSERETICPYSTYMLSFSQLSSWSSTTEW